MFVSVKTPTSKTVSAPEQTNVTHEDTTTSPQNTIRRSSRKRTASTRYDAESFTELHEEHEGPHQGQDPRTPLENNEKSSTKKRHEYESDDEYVPGENKDQNSQESEDSDEEST